MKPPSRSSRRAFLAATSGVLGAGGVLGQEADGPEASAARLAIEGGEKALRETPPCLAAGASPSASD